MGHWPLMGDDVNPKMGRLAGQICPAITLMQMRPKIEVFLEQRGYRLTKFHADMFGTDVDVEAYKHAVQLDKTFHIAHFRSLYVEWVASYIADAFDKMIGNVEILPPLFSPFIDEEEAK